MKPEIYSWNLHEQSLMGQAKFPSQPKIKIFDHSELRADLERQLELLSHKELAEWALVNAQPFLVYLNAPRISDPRIQQAIDAFQQKIAGEISAYEFRQAGFLANQIAKESKTPIEKYAARVFAQAIATAHMRGHALVSADYSVKVFNLLFPDNQTEVLKLRQKQIKTAQQKGEENR
ncbi:putative immunity protein [Enterococcus alishanensis]|uniref:Imm-5-like domain-containing protein n=1 Tax=Enterococcus alishanensis TaxID=1303817 RepID=A0ABS6TCK6_9ENTE|nr:hypothetical protein [Enterococcus alishanensis]MBV7390628.1 hypothetical protein [Enterococcus alishanensis]